MTLKESEGYKIRNSLGDLNNVLFEQLERLNDESLKADDLKEEISRAKAVADISSKVISNGNLVLEAAKFNDDRWDADAKLPKMLEG